MKINRIEIRNFRGCRALTLDSFPAMLLGMNGAGKTSAMHAIQAALFGRVFDHEGKQITSSQWVGQWGKDASVDVTINIEGEQSVVQLRVTASGQKVAVTGARPIQGRPAEVRAALWERIGKRQEHAECAANPRAYLLGGDLGALLAQINGGGVDHDKLHLACGAYFGWLESWCKQHRHPLDTMDHLSELGEAMYAERTVVNKDIKRLEQEIASMEVLDAPVNAKGAPLTVADLPAVESGIATLRKDRDALIEQKGRASAVYDGPSADDLRKAIDADRAELAKVEKKIAGAPESAKESRADIAKQAQRKHEIEATVADLSRRIAEQESALQEFKGGACPTCHQTLSDHARETLVGPIEAAIERDKTEMDEQKKALKGLASKIEADEKALDSVEAQIRACTEQAAKIRESLARADRDLLAASTAYAGPGEEELQGQIDGLDARIEKAEHARDRLLAMQDADAKRARLEGLKSEQERLNWAVDAFRGGTVTNALGSDGLAFFTGACNDLLSGHGYALIAQAEGKAVTVSLAKDGWLPVPVNQVSEGELILAQIAVAAAFADNGVPALIDGIERLDGEHRGTAIDLMESIHGAVVMAATYGLPNAPDIEAMADALAPVAVVWVGDVVAAEV
ncbi:MAG: AAA family ATPase [Verrucomicrobiota bacterium]|nr:AAA family ATPase [Verrucomicrobiota bacterium]